MCSSSGQKSSVRGPVVLKGRPCFRRALFTEVTLGVITYFAAPLAFYALTSVLGSPYPEHIPGNEGISDPFFVISPISAVFPALFSCRYLRHEYFVTRQHIITRKGKKLDQYPLALIGATEVKKPFRIDIFGTYLEIRIKPVTLMKRNAHVIQSVTFLLSGNISKILS